jgi:hypothetical protein
MTTMRTLIPCLGLATLLATGPDVVAQRVKLSPEELVQAEARSKVLCVSCHAWPDAALLDKQTWQRHVLPTMTLLCGHTNLLGEASRAYYRDLRDKGAALAQPLVTDAEFMSIGRYYIQTAPASQADRIRVAPVVGKLENFEVAGRLLVGTSPATYLVSIVPGADAVLLGDGGYGLWQLSSDGQRRAQLYGGVAPVAARATAAGLYVGNIGEFMPSERHLGSIHLLPRNGDGKSWRTLAEKLPRVADLAIADMNGDGREDIVGALFGFFSGRLSWFEQLADGRFREHVIYEKPGTVRVFVRDLNGDRRMDLVALVAQATEQVIHFIQGPDGGFTAEPLIQHHAAFGSSSMDLADFNGDGREDVLLANGDFDFPTPPRPYHGVRLFLRTDQGYELKYHFQLPGAYQARALDHDLDGDLDIAVVSLTPSFADRAVYNFAILENQGDYQFRVLSIPECLEGRWMTMDIGDLEGDGDPDIVLGSVLNVPGVIPEELQKQWQRRPVSALVLRNRAGDRKPDPKPVAPPSK